MNYLSGVNDLTSSSGVSGVSEVSGVIITIVITDCGLSSLPGAIASALCACGF